MFALILIYLFFPIITVLPNWDLKKSSINLLVNNNHSYVITHRKMYDLEAKLEKTINRLENGTITHKNKLCIDQTECNEVKFEQIESFYKVSGRRLLCPIGKYDPINLDNLQELPIILKKKIIGN